MSRFLFFFSFSLIFLILSSSFTSAVKCPKIPTDAIEDEFVVFLKDPAGLQEHFDLSTQCLKKLIKRFDKVFDKDNNNKKDKPDKNVVADYSFGKNAFYSGFFDNEFLKSLGERNDVDFIEKAVAVKIDYAINPPAEGYYRFERRTTQTTAPSNLDRIDQKDFPLNGNYTFPDKAGSGVNVYVVDTGIALNNVEFEGRARFGGTFCFNCSTTDDHGHGTQVAGIVGGKKFGVSKKTALIAVKVLNKDGQGSSTTILSGLSFIVDQHKNGTNKNTIINMSLGGALSQAINKMVSICTDAGIHVVVSAGDGSGDACNKSPASAPQAITVGATENTNKIASFTNTGSCVDIYAPGRDIVAAGNAQTNSLAVASGTSQSCPHVAGAVALIISKKGNLSPATMANELITLSTKDILPNANPNRFLRIPSP